MTLFPRASLLALLSLFCLGHCAGWAQTTSSTPMNYVSKNGKVVAKLSFAMTGCAPHQHWLNDQKDARGCIAEMRVFRSGVEGYFPDFSYKFLSTPRLVEVKEMTNGYSLKLTGGDASGSYVALFTFERDILKKRRIASGEFPDEAWEDSTFRFNLSNR